MGPCRAHHEQMSPTPQPDADTLARINELAHEEHTIRERESEGQASDDDRARLAEVEALLDQCWDVLRQRRARREFGLSPDEASPRPPGVINAYRQ